MEGARFCHKCGRPLFDEPLLQEAPPEPEQPSPSIAPPLQPTVTEISFRNRIAVNVGLAVGGMAIVANQVTSLVSSMALQMLSIPMLSLLSGLFAVWLYRRRTGETLSVRNGARLGWITGVFSFMITIMIITASVALVGIDKLQETFRDPRFASQFASSDMERIFSDREAFTGLLIAVLGVIFVLYAITASIGGALGAKMLEKDSAA